MRTLWQKILLLIVLSGWLLAGDRAPALADTGSQASSRIDAYAITVDDGEFIYLVGDAVNLSAKLPPGSLNLGGGKLDLWVAKLNRDGTPVFQALIGGKADDTAAAVAVRQGVIYILGETWSTDFPQAPGNAGENDAVVLALAADGSRILWARRFGGSDQDSGRALALWENNLYLTGITWSQDLISGAAKGDADGFLARLDLSGGLQWLKVFGGRGLDAPFGLAPGAGGVWVTGETFSPNLAGEPPGNGDIFALRFDANGAQQFAGLYGGSKEDIAYAAQLASDSSLYLTGSTQSAGLPGVIGQLAGGTDGFLIHLGADGSLRSTTYLGGEGQDAGMGLALLPGGDVVVAGVTTSASFPAGFTPAGTSKGGQDAFLARFSAAGALASASLQGGSGNDDAQGLAVTSSSIALVGSFSVGTLPYLLQVPAADLPGVTLPTAEVPAPTATLAPTATAQPTETPAPTSTATPVETAAPVDAPQSTETPTPLSAEAGQVETATVAEFSPTPLAQAVETLAEAKPTSTNAAVAAASTAAPAATMAQAPALPAAPEAPQNRPAALGLWLGGGLVLAALGLGLYYNRLKNK